MPSRTKTATAPARERPAPSVDNYFDDDFDPFASDTDDGGRNKNKSETGTKRKEPDSGLGIDEEVQVKKRPRPPPVKLDETRLLSEKGIPRLRRSAKNLKFKGKGHEFSDAARLLSFYQLWLDELFPKAKFLDALAMVEKAGHGKSMAVLRKQWIDEGKPRTHMDDGEDELPTAGAGGETQRNGQAGETEEATRLAPVFEMARTQKAKTPTRETDPFASDEDIYDATPRRPAAGGGQVIEADLQGNDAPPDDDLEALMAETDIQPAPTSLFSGSIFGGPRPAVGTAKERPNVPDDDDEDLEALLAEEEAQRSSATGQAGTASVRSSIFGGDEHAQAAGAESVVDKALKPTSVTETHADDGIGAEEEEAMGEMDGLW